MTGPAVPSPIGRPSRLVIAITPPAVVDENSSLPRRKVASSIFGKAVEKIEGGSLYRTFVTGFASRADAQAFCARLQSAGKSCFVR